MTYNPKVIPVTNFHPMFSFSYTMWVIIPIFDSWFCRSYTEFTNVTLKTEFFVFTNAFKYYDHFTSSFHWLKKKKSKQTYCDNNIKNKTFLIQNKQTICYITWKECWNNLTWRNISAESTCARRNVINQVRVLYWTLCLTYVI